MYVPDLFRVEEPERAFLLYALAVRQCKDPGVAVSFSRRVRVLARRAGGQESLLETCFHRELEALFQTGQHRRALALVRRRRKEMARLGIDLSESAHWNDHCLAPVLHAAGHHDEARAVRERSLRKHLANADLSAFDILFFVYNSVGTPRHPSRVSLYHIYQPLGLRLLEWPQWAEFVERLHPDLLRCASIDRDDLLLHPERLTALVAAIRARRAERLTTGVSRGEADLIEPPATVAASQAEISEKKRAYHERTAAQRTETSAQILQYFPFLRSWRGRDPTPGRPRYQPPD
ncbi:MAG: hypothetical protein V4850_14385 [Myxococcota bacterium]